MAIINYQFDSAGEVGVQPRICRIQTTDSLATITAANYLKYFEKLGEVIYPTDIFAISYGTSTIESQFFTPTFSGSDITLAPGSSDVILPVVSGNFCVFSGTNGAIDDAGYSPSDATKTEVVMAAAAVVANRIACFTDTAGTVNDDAATAINGGNLQAGLSGTAGYVASFPGTAAKGSLRVTAVANTGDTVTTISNAAMGQASVISIPDPAQTTAEFIISDSASTQHITSGNLQVDAGDLMAGSSGNSGSLISYSSTPTTGSLHVQATANGGDFDTIITNAPMGQSSVISIPDPADPTANFVVAPSALVNNNLVKASGVAGLVVDAGARIIANTTAAYGGGGTNNVFAATGLTAAAKGTAVIRASTNSVSITKALPGTDQLDITFSADPGAGTTVDYIYVTAAMA